MQSTTPRFDARDYLRIIQKRKWFIILVALAAMLIGGLYAVSYPKTYRASSSILVRKRPEGIVWLTDPSARTGEGDLALATQASIITSSELAADVSSALRVKGAGESVIADAEEIQNSLQADALPPERIRITAQSGIDRHAVAFANEAAEQFLLLNTDIRRDDDRRAREYLEEQLRKTDEQLDEMQTQMTDFMDQMGVYSEDAGTQQTLGTLAVYQSHRDQTEADLAAARAQLGAIEGLMSGSGKGTQTVPNPTVMALRNSLTGAELALSELKGRYRDNHPAVQQQQDRVETLRAQIAAAPTTIDVPYGSVGTGAVTLGSQRDALVTREADLVARLATLSGFVAELQEDARRLPERISGLTRLRAKVNLLTSTHARLLQELESKRLAEEATGGSGRILDTATRAVSASPSVSRGLLFAGVLGIVAGIALALVLEALDDTIHTPEELTRDTELTFLGMVPYLETGMDDLITISAPKSPPAESYRTLRSNVTFSLVEEPVRRFLVTSAGAGEGKTMTAANLAVTFAQAGQSVLLVDTDLRRPSLHRYLHCESTRGLTNVLVGEATVEDVVQDTHVEGLRLIASGPLPPNPAEMLDSAAMRRLIDELQTHADVIFFDSPPALVLTDAVILSSKIERTILVAEAGQVTREAFNEAVRLIRNARGNILGAILNKLRLSASDYYYYYYYYDYSREAPRVIAPPLAEED